MLNSHEAGKPNLPDKNKNIPMEAQILSALFGPLQLNPPKLGPYGAGVAEQLRNKARTHKRQNVTDFVNRVLKGLAQPKESADFLFDAERTGRIGLEMRRRLQDLTSQETLSRPQTSELVQLLLQALNVAECSLNDQDIQYQNSKTTVNLLKRHAFQLILEKSPDFPLMGCKIPETDLTWSFATAVHDVVYAHSEPDRWHDLLDLLSSSADQIIEQPDSPTQTQTLPHWFDLQTMVVKTPSIQLNYNWLHNSPIELTASFQKNVPYLEQVLLNARRLKLSVPTTARLLLQPYIDQQAAHRLSEHEPEDFYYTDDGPINYQEPLNRRFLQGEIANAANHHSASYCRNIRETIMNRGIAADIETNRPDLLAMSLPRNALALQRLLKFQQELQVSRSKTDPADRQQPARETPIDWNLGTNQGWQTLLRLTDNLTQNSQLAEAIKNLLDRSIASHRVSDLVDPDEPSRNYSFVPRLEPDPSTDSDHPTRLLLREALKDLYQALEDLDQIDQERVKEPANHSKRQRIASSNMARFKKENRSAEFIEAVQDYLDNDYVHQPGDPDLQTSYEELRDQAALDLLTAGIEYSQVQQLTANNRIAALYDNVLRSLAHADFNLQAIADQPGT